MSSETEKIYPARDILQMVYIGGRAHDRYSYRCPECGTEGEFSGDQLDRVKKVESIRKLKLKCNHTIAVSYK